MLSMERGLLTNNEAARENAYVRSHAPEVWSALGALLR